MKLFAMLLCALLTMIVPARADTEALCRSRAGAPYWHADASCQFAETGWYGEMLPTGEEAREIAVAQAQAAGQKPCPGCAAAFPPTFTGDFPDWPWDGYPWDYDAGEVVREDDGWPVYAHQLPADVLRAWGNPGEALHRLYPEDDMGFPVGCPSDWAGIYANNACGGYTVLLKDPTPESVAEWRALLGGEFWVIAAKYGVEELRPLYAAVVRLMAVDVERRREGEEAAYHIVSVGSDDIGNRVVIGVTGEDYEILCAALSRILSAAGFARDMYGFASAEYPSWDEDF